MGIKIHENPKSKAIVQVQQSLELFKGKKEKRKEIKNKNKANGEALKLEQLQKGASVSSRAQAFERSRKQSNKCLKLAETTKIALCTPLT